MNLDCPNRQDCGFHVDLVFAWEHALARHVKQCNKYTPKVRREYRRLRQTGGRGHWPTARRRAA